MNREEELKGIIKELRKIKKKIKAKIWVLNNPEKKQKNDNRWRNSESGKKKEKEYRESNQGKKVGRIASWKYIGLIEDDYNIIYDRYIKTTNCDWCDCILTYDAPISTATTKCMDHCHVTGKFRNILCCACNSSRK